MTEPPWQAVALFSDRLDPRTLAVSSCVCKSWSLAMSSDRLWAPLCAANFPSLSLISTAGVPPRRLYALGSAAAARRLKSPPKPRLSLSDLLFAVTVSTNRNDKLSPIASAVRPCGDANSKGGGVFAFEVGGFSPGPAVEGEEEVRVTWSVAVRGWSGVVTVVDGEGRAEGWFSSELAVAGCWCCGGGPRGRGSGMAAEAKVVMGEKGGVERVSVGIMDVVNWRYVTVEDGLSYLQHFLLPLDPLHHHTTTII